MQAGRIGVIGAGNMGSGIAQKAATEGATVVLVDLSEAALERGMATIRGLLEQGVERRVFKPKQAEAILGRLIPTTSFEDLAECELVIEAVFEDLGVKGQVFGTLDRVCDPQAVLATNTSSFRVTDLQRDLQHPERVVGLHFFFHPAKNRLVEVIGGDATDPEVVSRAWRMMNVMGKTPISSSDAEGFVVNRFFVPWLNEGVRLMEEGLGTPGQIDAVACKAFGVGMGPFALMNATGVPITMHAANTLKDAFGPFYAPADALNDIVGRGDSWTIDEAQPLDDDAAAAIATRLRGAAWLACGQLVDEKISDPMDTDIGARVGLRWGRGPFEMANEFGVAEAAAEIAALASAWSLAVPAVFSARGGSQFDLPYVSCAVEAHVATITFNRPSQLNPLSPRLLDDLEVAWKTAMTTDGVRSVVLRGAGKAFMAGADLKYFADAYDRDDVDGIVTFAKRAAAQFDKIDKASQHVIAVLDGLSLGGGSELALCADTIVGTDRGTIGFPETGLGIYPGLGGTQRSTRRIGRPLARWMVLSGEVLNSEAAHALGLVDVVTTRDKVDQVIAELASLAEGPSSTVDQNHPMAEAATRLLSDDQVEGWLAKTNDPGEDPAAARLAKRLGHKGPVALRVANDLIGLADAGADVTEGLTAEADGLKAIFDTYDAKSGIRAALSRQRPSFEGR
ncbi:MAG: 3-hydroxyacyl-CoA dehydrogenase/enoyl-CoA hydratase family protein [Myxococcota bacterium]